MHPSFVQSDAQFREILQRLEGQAELYLDCEFHTEGRFFPKLCLVQLAFGTEFWAISTRRVNLRALAPILQSPSISKVFHDGRQDIPILVRATGATEVRAVFDTQIAAAFAGYGSSIGYGALIQQLCGVELDKSLQMSDWSRDLSDAQIEYALDDVRYLPSAYAALCAKLAANGRLDWTREACAESVSRALTRPDPELLYRKVAAASRLTASQLGILRELAKWRNYVAEALDKPTQSVANDLALKSMAVRPPHDLGGVDGVRGLGAGRTQPWANKLLEAIAFGKARPELKPRALLSREQEMRVEGILSLLGVARRFVASREEIAAELLADQSELRALAEWHLLQQPTELTLGVLVGWRRAVIGELLLAALSGETAFRVDAAALSGIELVHA